MSKTYPMKCRIQAEGGVTRVDIYDDIGEGSWFSDGISAKGFAAKLADIKGPLDVHINSYGGDVADGITIASNIRGYKGAKKTVVDGFACSIASVIAQSAGERVMQPGSMMMIHDALSFCVGNAADMRSQAEELDKHSDNIASIYADRAGGTVAEWRDVMRSTTWYTAEEAVAAGLADRVGDGEAASPAGLDLDVAAFEMVPGRIAARLQSMPRAKVPAVVNADGTHAPMTGTHTHSHPAYGSQGGDSMHSHEHSHDGDASHGHGHADGGAEDRARGDAGPGRCCAMCGPECACAAAPASARSRGRILGIESMPLADKALPVHHTATEDSAWDGPAAVAAMPNDDAVLRYCHAWEDSDAASVSSREGDDDADDQKQDYKFPHHRTEGGPANLAACRNGLARLSSADIPAGDDAGVKAHLQAHLDDGSDGGAAGNAHQDLSGMTPEQIRAALRGATE